MARVFDFHGDTKMRGVAEKFGIPGLQQEVTWRQKAYSSLFDSSN